MNTLSHLNCVFHTKNLGKSVPFNISLNIEECTFIKMTLTMPSMITHEVT